MKRMILLLSCLVALASPGAAQADDAGVTAAVARWSVKIAKPAKQLTTKISASSTPTEALGFLRSFTKTATNGAKAIGATRASTKKGAQVRTLARNGFAQYAAAGRLLIEAVNDFKAGKPQSVTQPRVNKAIGLASAGSTKLAKAAKLIPQLVGG
jgi:orotidine-5'-phosphate decarboxylase